jgi:hypothetical protein
VIAEFGCALGLTSVLPLRAIIQAVREKNPDIEFLIMINDLPENNHGQALICVTQGLSDLEGITINANGKSFETQVFPSNFIDIAFTEMTAHILAERPCDRDENTFFFYTHEKYKTEWGKKWTDAFVQQWRSFASCRVKELRKHGLIFSSVMITEDTLKDYQVNE